MAEPTTEPGQWLTQAEAASRLGWQLERLKSAARRGKFQRRKGNAGQWLVLVTPELMAEPDQGGDHADDDAMAMLREELTEAKAEAAHATGRAAALSEAMSELGQKLAAAQQQAEHWRVRAEAAERQAAVAEADRASLRTLVDRLDAELDRLRRPWLERLGDVLRRR